MNRDAACLATVNSECPGLSPLWSVQIALVFPSQLSLSLQDKSYLNRHHGEVGR